MPKRVEDITGKRFNRLVALRFSHRAYGKAQWVFKCDCGRTHVCDAYAARHGCIKSCGCLRRDTHTKHGACEGGLYTAEYNAWRGMRRRCTNRNAKSFKDYGGRGITICERWNAFTAFYEDMGPRPTKRHSIDRIDNNGNYEPSNCRWALPLVQGNNKSWNKYIFIHGKRYTISQAAAAFGISRPTLDGRLKIQKLSPEEAVSRPVRRNSREYRAA